MENLIWLIVSYVLLAASIIFVWAHITRENRKSVRAMIIHSLAVGCVAGFIFAAVRTAAQFL